MYISYDKLWKMLIDKKINKTEFSQLSGLSSRTVAKLVRNESVTTDTLIHICTALNCDLNDIMEMKHEEQPISLFDAFRTQAEFIQEDEDESFRLFQFYYRGKKVLLKKSVDKANKHTVIHCNENSVTWEQIQPLGWHPISTLPYTFDTSFWEPDAICLIVISGKPMCFQNLDEYMFTSSRGTPKYPRHIYVMSETAFKLFEPSHEIFPDQA